MKITGCFLALLGVMYLAQPSISYLTAASPIYYRAAQWSPDGEKLAFYSNQNGNDDIWIANADGSNLINLTQESTVNNRFPMWSPDGLFISYSEVNETTSEVWIMRRDGNNKLNLSQALPEASYFPRWSPDGHYIAFLVDVIPGVTNEIWLAETNNFQIHKLGNFDHVFIRSISWSPTGASLAFTRTIVDPTVSSIKDLKSLDQVRQDGVWQIDVRDDVEKPIVLDKYVQELSWGANNELLLSVREESTTDIWIVNADGTELTNLTTDIDVLVSDPVFSPDAQFIALMVHREDVLYSWDIWVMKRDGSSKMNLTENLNYANGFPDWNPDGKRITFESHLAPDSDFSSTPESSIWLVIMDKLLTTKLIG